MRKLNRGLERLLLYYLLRNFLEESVLFLIKVLGVEGAVILGGVL